MGTIIFSDPHKDLLMQSKKYKCQTSRIFFGYLWLRSGLVGVKVAMLGVEFSHRNELSGGGAYLILVSALYMPQFVLDPHVDLSRGLVLRGARCGVAGRGRQGGLQGGRRLPRPPHCAVGGRWRRRKIRRGRWDHGMGTAGHQLGIQHVHVGLHVHHVSVTGALRVSPKKHTQQKSPGDRMRSQASYSPQHRTLTAGRCMEKPKDHWRVTGWITGGLSVLPKTRQSLQNSS